MRVLLIIALLTLAGCGSRETVTTKSPYSKSEVFDLEIRVIKNDVDAMKKLQEHYDFAHMYDKREDMHQKLLALDDYDAMIEESEILSLDADEVTDKTAKKRLLDKAMALAVKAANKMQVKDVSKDPSVKMIQKDLDNLEMERK